jgi:hypothetical protein
MGMRSLGLESGKDGTQIIKAIGHFRHARGHYPMSRWDDQMAWAADRESIGTGSADEPTVGPRRARDVTRTSQDIDSAVILLAHGALQ